MSKSFADVMASSKNGRRRASMWICLSPELADRYSELSDQYDAAVERESTPSDPDRVNTSRRLSGDVRGSSESFKAQMVELIADNPESFYEVVVEQKNRAEWMALRAQHGPRDGVVEDAGFYNAETFPPAAVRASMVDPEPTDEVYAFLEENLSSGEWDRLALLVWSLNEGVRSVPKAALA